MNFFIGQKNEYHYHSNQHLAFKDTSANHKDKEKAKSTWFGFLATLSLLIGFICVALIIDAEAFVTAMVTIALIVSKWLELLQNYIT